MSNTPLSMTPTGWFQVAWSEEIAVGAVHRMTYFGRDMVAWRAQSGRLAVMDAHCEHLGAHLGYGGHVRGEAIQCPFHGWQWDARGHNVAIPYEPRPNPGRRMRTYPVTERNESVYIWHDAGSNGGAQREPFFEVPDVFADFRGGCVSDYHPQMRLYRERVRLHPQYVLENGVDFAHFTFVHNTPIVPLFTRQDFDGPVSYVDFTITFDGDDGQSIDDVTSGVEAINGGLGVAVTTSWGMVDNRTISAITPVDESTCDVRFMVYIGRRPGDGSEKTAAKATDFGQMVIDQFAADIDIWSHQRYQPNPALAPSEHDSFMAFRTWAAQFYPDVEAYPESDTA